MGNLRDSGCVHPKPAAAPAAPCELLLARCPCGRRLLGGRSRSVLFGQAPGADSAAQRRGSKPGSGVGGRGLGGGAFGLRALARRMDLKKFRLTWTKVHVTRWQANVSVGRARGINLPHRAVRGPGPWTTSPKGRVSLRLIGSNPARN